MYVSVQSLWITQTRAYLVCGNADVSRYCSIKKKPCEKYFTQGKRFAWMKLILFLVSFLPGARIFKKLLNLGQGAIGKGFLRFGFGQNVPPSAEMVQCDAVITERFFGLWENVLVENDCRVVAGRTSFANRIDEAELRAAVGG